MVQITSNNPPFKTLTYPIHSRMLSLSAVRTKGLPLTTVLQTVYFLTTAKLVTIY